MLIQIIITLFVIINLINLFKNFHKYKKITFFSWCILWLLILISVWIQNSLTLTANFLGIGRGADFAFYVSILILFYFIFRITSRLEKIEKNITALVRKDALTNAKQLNKETDE
jgi:hypothetical protein